MNGKGDTPRPMQIDKQTFSNNWDRIFKSNTMTPKVQEEKEEIGKCGCGRSPTGKCIGWHGLTEQEYQVKLEEYLTNREDSDGNPT